MQDGICKHCGWPIFRAKDGDEWKHFHNMLVECDPHPKAEPKTNNFGYVIPAFEKNQQIRP